MSKIACLQMASGPGVLQNLDETARLIKLAAKAGAKLVVLPENFAVMGKDADMLAAREKEGSGKIQNFLAKQAKSHGLWIVGGTLPLEGPSEDKVYSACLVYNAAGKCVARYDKIHLFDVSLDTERAPYHESKHIVHGSKPVVCETPFGKLGLAVCYDLRFPELFRALIDADAEIIALPAAFTAETGRAHWESLVRARAIENLVFVAASAQGGFHKNGRETYGHSMIVDPWGTILDELDHSSGIAFAEIDLNFLHSRRRTFPCLTHRKIK